MYDVWSNPFSRDIHRQKYSYDGQEDWAGTARRVAEEVTEGAVRQHGQRLLLTASEIAEVAQLIYDRKFIPGGRYLYAAGRDKHQVNNCFLFRAEDSRQGWASLLDRSVNALMTGGGIGVDYSEIRPNGAPITGSRGHATGPLSVMHMVNEAGRHVMQGGQRRSAIWAGLSWWHPDVQTFLRIKDWSAELRSLKEQDFNFPAPMELTNVSVIYDDLFFELLNGTRSSADAHAELDNRIPWYGSSVDWGLDLEAHAREVWRVNMRKAFSTAEPGFSFNPVNWRDSLRNACTEVTSEDDSDRCNLGTVWMSAHDSLEDFQRTVELATKFLMVGAIYSDLPTEKTQEVGDRNNRIGLGLGGMHEWLMQRGERYVVTDEMHQWLRVYEQASDETAASFAREIDVAEPKAKRAIAPTGTIGILAETTTGIEPLFCKAYKRRYYKDGKWLMQYVVDGAVKRLRNRGVALEQIQDSYDITFEERVRFQAEVQGYVDMAISSTCNLPSWGSEQNNEETLEEHSRVLLEAAPHLRGFTVYPDGARGGQPLSRVDLEEALASEGLVWEEREDECVGGICGI